MERLRQAQIYIGVAIAFGGVLVFLSTEAAGRQLEASGDVCSCWLQAAARITPSLYDR